MFSTLDTDNNHLLVYDSLPLQLKCILEDIRSNIGNNIFLSDPVKLYKGISSSTNHTSYELYDRYYRTIRLAHKTAVAHRKHIQRFHLRNTPYSIKLREEVSKHFRQYHVRQSNEIIYPSDGGFMGWHTNWDSPATRLYLSYVDESDKSFFRYVDPITQEIVTSYDKKGWTARLFKVTRDPLFWHCVYSETPRISIGFRITKMK